MRWQFSNPIGYAEWFYDRMRQAVLEEKKAVAKRAQVDVDDVPDWQVKTTLQRVVQVLKAHRNYFFADDLQARPPSILLTTLAAHAYRGTVDLFGAVMDVATDMPSYIERDGSIYIVRNPVQPEENFADRWDERQAVRYFDWISDLQSTLDEAKATTSGLDKMIAPLAKRFGESAVRKSAKRLGLQRTAARGRGNLAVTGTGALAVGSGGVRVKEHIFYGE